MEISFKTTNVAKRTFNMDLGELILVLRRRERTMPILGVFSELSNDFIDREIGRGHYRSRLIISPALTLEPFAKVYGKEIPQIKFRRELSFSSGTEIAELIIGKFPILTHLEGISGFEQYAHILSHLPEQGPYNTKEFMY